MRRTDLASSVAFATGVDSTVRSLEPATEDHHLACDQRAEADMVDQDALLTALRLEPTPPSGDFYE
jgi:hypothetical protein